MISIYQTKEYKNAINNKNIVNLVNNHYALEKIISLPIFGSKKILDSRGLNNIKEIEIFKNLAKRYFYGVIAPPIINTNHEIFKKLNYIKISNYTILINLKKSEEELWQNLEKKSVRWGIKTAIKNNLKFELVQDKNEICKFYELYKKTAEIGGFSAEDIDFIVSLANTPASKLFLIKNKDEIVAGGLVLIDKDYNYSVLDLTAASPEGFNLQAMPFLYWNIIKYSKNFNLDFFDLGGYDKEAKRGHKTYNINKFKERFGGQIVEQPMYSTNWAYPFLRHLLKRFVFVKKIYEKK